MSIYCQQCGTQNEDGAKFCKNCGLPLNKQLEQFDEVVKATSIEPIESIKAMRLSMLAVFPVLGMIYHLMFIGYGVIMIETIAASFSAVIVILGIPLIFTGIVRMIKKLNNTSYPNFVKHTFIGTGIMFVLAIGSMINS
ncbi:MAG: zinc-ribbon domain-containing protein [Bacteroidales bacterium]|nr:zinc-ribbon domain-containing protein [Bacteroidales bacterium]